LIVRANVMCIFICNNMLSWSRPITTDEYGTFSYTNTSK
jgi:hypothetical protein